MSNIYEVEVKMCSVIQLVKQGHYLRISSFLYIICKFIDILKLETLLEIRICQTGLFGSKKEYNQFIL